MIRVQITLPDEDGAALKALADEEDRGVAQQARHMLRWALIRSRHDQWRAGKLQHPQSDSTSPEDFSSLGGGASRRLQGEHQPETHDLTGNADD